MRLLHTSDWHVGRTLHGADLAPAIDLFIDWLVDTVRERAVDVVMISGDVFDRAIPPVTAVHQLSQALRRLTDVVPVVVTSGNHDSATRLGFASGLLRQELRIITDVEQIGVPVEIALPSGERTLIYPIPYVEPETTRHALARRIECEHGVSPHAQPDVPRADGAQAAACVVPRSHQGVLDAAMSLVWRDLEERRRAGDDAPAVAMIHAFVTGAKPCDSEHDIRVSGIEYVSASTFDAPFSEGLSYVAAGHLHRPQDVGGARVPIRYCGSPVAYSFSEAGAAKGVTVVDVRAGESPVIEHVPGPVWRDVAVIRGSVEELVGEEYVSYRDSFVHVTVTDPVRPEHMLTRIRQVFAHALVVLHDSGRTVDTDRAPSVRHAPSDREVSSGFFEEIGGRPLTAVEAGIVDDVWAEIRQAGAGA